MRRAGNTGNVWDTAGPVDWIGSMREDGIRYLFAKLSRVGRFPLPARVK